MLGAQLHIVQLFTAPVLPQLTLGLKTIVSYFANNYCSFRL